MSAVCEEVRISLGVYVLGAIEPAERALVDTHIGGCPGCRDELAGMAGLPALLGRVSEEQIAQLAGPPEELLDTLMTRAAEERRRARHRLGGLGRWMPLAAAAAVLLLVGGLFGTLMNDSQGHAVSARPAPTVTVTQAPTPTPTKAKDPPAEKLSAKNTGAGISAMLEVRKDKGGTVAELHLTGVPAGTRCRLDALTRDGRHDSMGSWRVTNKGYTGFYGGTMFPRDQVTAFKIITSDGRTLLTIPA